MDLSILQEKYGSPVFADFGWIPFRCYALNLLLGGRGLPMNKFVEIYGPESCGKTTLGLELLEQAAMQGCITMIADQEKQIDENRIAKFHLYKGKNTIIFRVRYIEELFDHLDEIIEFLKKNKDNRPIVLLIDSAGVMIPRQVFELKDSVDNGRPGITAYAWGNQLKRYLAKQNDVNITIIFLNHQTEVFSTMPTFGAKPHTTPGGRVFKHLQDTRIQINNAGAIKSGTDRIGNEIVVKIIKYRSAPPYQSVKVPLYFGNPQLAADKDFAGTHDGLAALWHLKEMTGAVTTGKKSKCILIDPIGNQTEVTWSGIAEWCVLFESYKPLIYNTMLLWHYSATRFHQEMLKNNPQAFSSGEVIEPEPDAPDTANA